MVTLPVSGEDRERFYEIVDDVIARVSDTKGPNTSKGTDLLIATLWGDLNFPTPWIKRLHVSAVRGWAANVIKDRVNEGLAFVTLPSGKTIAIRQSFSRKARRADGTREEFYQAQMFIDFSWDELVDHIEQLQALGGRLFNEAQAEAAYLPLRARFPDSRTPREACELAGIDPLRFNAELLSTGTDGTS